ncbi:phosphatidylinositol 3-kinase catalytic subunit type 3 [Striga asiatica]|uniref:Phosphatidylinositol 3-kinase catalytic subunit type 3 n=1 Tax=Striga asiatica TaxID=4170 RepID=A0A5A7QDR7_STRAF|nr:phosphatidylinositol 3-kinase catalytic subunit type 3 [Striga asiatica]
MEEAGYLTGFVWRPDYCVVCSVKPDFVRAILTSGNTCRVVEVALAKARSWDVGPYLPEETMAKVRVFPFSGDNEVPETTFVDRLSHVMKTNMIKRKKKNKMKK